MPKPWELNYGAQPAAPVADAAAPAQPKPWEMNFAAPVARENVEPWDIQDSAAPELPPTTAAQRGEVPESFVGNTLRQVPARAADLLGNLIASGQGADIPGIERPHPIRDLGQAIASIGDDVGNPYADQVTQDLAHGQYLEALKHAPAATPGVVAQSLPDILGLSRGMLPAYVAARGEELDQQRGEGQSSPLTSTGGALASALLDKFGLERILKFMEPGGSGALMSAIKGAGIEAPTEAIQNVIEYLTSTLGTKQGANADDAKQQALAGLLLGGAAGGTMGGAAAVTGKAAPELAQDILSQYGPAPEPPAPPPPAPAPPLALPPPPATPVTIEGRAAPEALQEELSDTPDVREARRAHEERLAAAYDAAQRKMPVPLGEAFDAPIPVTLEGRGAPERLQQELSDTPEVRAARRAREEHAIEAERQAAFDNQARAEEAAGAPPAEALFEQRAAEQGRATDRRTEAQQRAAQGGVMADALLRSGALDKPDARVPERPEGPSRTAEEPIERAEPTPALRDEGGTAPVKPRTVSAAAFRSMSPADQQVVREAGLQPTEETTTPPAASPAGPSSLDLNEERAFLDDRAESTNDVHTPESLGHELKARLKQVGIDEAVSARVVPQIVTTLGGKAAIGKGRYQSARKLIEVAMGSPEKGAYDKVTHTFVINHEIVHALKDLGLFSDAEWRVLTRAALKDHATWDGAQRYKGRVPTEKLLEEAVSDMHGAWVAGRFHGEGAVARVMDRIHQFIQSIRDTFSQAGYKSAQEIFEAIDRGDFGKRLKERTDAVQMETLPEEDLLDSEDSLDLEQSERKKSLRDRIRAMQDEEAADADEIEMTLPEEPPAVESQEKLTKEERKRLDSDSLDLDDDQLRDRAAQANARRTARKAAANEAAKAPEDKEKPNRGDAASSIKTRPHEQEADDFISTLKPNERNVYTKAAQKAIDTFNDKLGWRYSSLGKLPEQKRYLRDRYLALGKVDAAQDIGKEVYSALSQADESDQRSVYNYLTTRDADASLIASPPVRTAAVKTKELIDSLGKRLVSEGLLPKEAYEQYAGEYLPRVYLKHLLGDQNVRALGDGKKVSDLGYLKKRKDIPEDVRRVILGEIKDPAFLASFGLARTGRDLAILDFLKQVSANKKWVPGKATIDWNGKQVSPFWLRQEARELRERARHYQDKPTADEARDLAEQMEVKAENAISALGASPGADYTQVPDSARYGAMRGLWVRKEIYDDLVGSQQFVGNDQQSFIESVLAPGGKLERASAWWKASKVAWNPPSQVRNFITNMGLLNLVGGVPMHRIPDTMTRSLKSIIQKDQYYKIAKKYGLFQSTFSNTEMARIRDEWIQQQKGSQSTLGTLKAMGGSLVNFAGDTYQLMEAIGKIAKLRDAMQREGKSEAQAMLEAHETLFDYSLVPKGVRYARTAALGAPFITFTYKVLPALMKAAVKYPHRYLPYAALFGGMQALLQGNYQISDEDYEHLRNALPSWMNERGHMALWPYKDESGKWQAVDLGYLMPWGPFADAAATARAGKPLEAAENLGLLSGPVPTVVSAIKTNMDPFTKKPIVNPADPPEKKLAAIMNYTWTLAAPGFLTEYGAIPKMAAALQGKVNPRTGEANASLAQSALRFFGINVYPTDPQASRAQNLRAMKNELTEIKSRMRQQLRDRNLTDQDRADITTVFQKLINKQVELMRQYAADSELSPNLTGEEAPEAPVAPPQASNKRVPFAELLARVEKQESGGNEDAVSPKGAVGPLQTMPETLRDPGFGVEPASEDTHDEQRRVGTDYLKAMLKEFNGNQTHALMAYNWGPGNVKKWVANGSDKAQVPAETRGYVNNILQRTVL